MKLTEVGLFHTISLRLPHRIYYIEGIKLMEIEAVNMENKVRSVTKDEKRTKYNGKDIHPSLLE